MISKAELNNRLKGSLDGVHPADMQTVWGKLLEHLSYCSQHYEELEGEAKAIVDEQFDILEEGVEQGLSQAPESVRKRELVRLRARAHGKHHQVTDFLLLLEQSPQDHLKLPFTEDAKAIFIEGTQRISDFLFDASQKPLGPPHNVCFGLFFHCIDELLAGIHLAQHAYCMQAYAHARGALESLDKIELFVKQPQWIEVWIGDDERKIYNELRPKEVRKKLGNPLHDPLYSALSRLGSHASFKALQGRMVFTNEGASVWCGGSPQVHHMLWAHFHLLHAMLSVYFKVIRVFDTRLNQEEVLKATEGIVQRFANYLIKHFVPWAKKNGIHVEDIEQDLRNGLRSFGLEGDGEQGVR